MEPDPEFGPFNTLKTVSSGDILWVRVRAGQSFMGLTLWAGWNHIVLP